MIKNPQNLECYLIACTLKSWVLSILQQQLCCMLSFMSFNKATRIPLDTEDMAKRELSSITLSKKYDTSASFNFAIAGNHSTCFPMTSKCSVLSHARRTIWSLYCLLLCYVSNSRHDWKTNLVSCNNALISVLSCTDLWKVSFYFFKCGKPVLETNVDCYILLRFVNCLILLLSVLRTCWKKATLTCWGSFTHKNNLSLLLPCFTVLCNIIFIFVT